MTDRYSKVVVLGMDGLDPNVLGLLVASGAAPNLARLWQGQASGRLATANPAQSPVAWTTLATGTNPGKHGVYDFIHRKRKNYIPYLSISQTGKSGLLGSSKFINPRMNTAFWEALSAQGIPTTVVRWPVSFPADEINGRMFAGLGVPDIAGGLGRYTMYTNDAELIRKVAKNRIKQVDPSKGTIETVADGPKVQGLKKPVPKTVPLAIKMADKAVVLTIEGNTFELPERSWSDWVRISFSTGPMQKVSAIVKFYLVQTQPTLKLYMTPVEIDPRDAAIPFTSPPEYAPQLAEKIGLYHTLGMPEDTQALNDKSLTEEAFVAQCDEVTEERLKMFRHEFNLFDEGLFAFVFDTSDRIQHMFWKENEFDAQGKLLKIGPRINEHFAKMDALLGEVLDSVDDSTALILLSDHGFTNYDTNVDLNAWLVSEGLMTLKSKPTKFDDDNTAIFRLVDWSRTKAYALGFSSIYLNLRGREGKGVVAADEADELSKKISERLAAYRDPSGKAPIAASYDRRDIYSGFDNEVAPDIVVGFSPGYCMARTTAIGGVNPEVLSANERHWCGDHIVDPSTVPGTIMSNVPVDMSRATACDVAPTVLKLLGVGSPEECEGQSLV
jgi:predicted AlkP superfamily phosphohydrolase/phosphomutase